MPKASLAPGFIKIQQTTIVSTVPMDHYQTLGIYSPTWSGATSTIQRRNAANVLWTTALGELITLMRPLFSTATTFIGAELWRQDTPTSDPSFVATTLLGLAGTTGTVQNATQALFEFKGTDDSSLRFTLIESNIAANLRHPYTGMTANEKALVDYLVGTTNWVITRGNSFPDHVGFKTSKVNDKIRKHRFNL